MARRTFGGTAADFLTDSRGNVESGGVGTVWTARTGGTQITDLLDANGAPVTTVSALASPEGMVLFSGPDDGTSVVWVDFGGGRVKMVAHDGYPALDNNGDIAAAAVPDLSGTYVAVGSLVFNVKDYGAAGDGLADDTAEIQAAIDAAYAAGGGVVWLPAGDYAVSASSLSETYDNAGAAVAANTFCVIVRKGVSLAGGGAQVTAIVANDPTLSVVGLVAPDSQAIIGLSVRNSYDAGDAGAGHGIFVLGTQGGADITCKNTTWRDLYVNRVASYGIGLQAGSPTGCRIESVTVEGCGADGLDLKARTDASTEPSGNQCVNVTVKNHGQRVDGSAGVDVRGVWHLSNVVVTDFGANNNALNYAGIRFRTKPPVTDAYNRAAARSSLTGFYIRPTVGAAPLSLTGIESGSDYVTVSNGYIEGCTNGVTLTGNTNGSATHNKIHGVTASGSTQYGFYVVSGVTYTTLSSCTTLSSTTAGYRNEGISTTLLGCNAPSEAAPLSTSSGALPTEVILGCAFANETGVTVTSPAAGRVSVAAKGSSADIDLALDPKGSGVLRFGAHTASADAPVSGYITVKDSGGTTRKIAVIT